MAARLMIMARAVVRAVAIGVAWRTITIDVARSGIHVSVGFDTAFATGRTIAAEVASTAAAATSATTTASTAARLATAIRAITRESRCAFIHSRRGC